VSIQLDYRGEIVWVTGGATGLGLATARAFAVAGASIALNDLEPTRVESARASLRAFPVPCLACPADVRDASAIAACLEIVERELGPPSIVVANAGLYPNTPFLELTEDEWDRVIDTNLKGVFLVCQAAARIMIRAGIAGRIIVTGSTAALRAIYGWSHYCASKAAVVMLARAMALELGEHGIRVNAVLPGYVDVPEGGSHLSPAYRESARAAAALGRAGTPEDVARAVLLLASPLADYISGTTLVVDGGASAGPVGLRVIEQ